MKNEAPDERGQSVRAKVIIISIYCYCLRNGTPSLGRGYHRASSNLLLLVCMAAFCLLGLAETFIVLVVIQAVGS
jgi:hypothetical protein